MIQKIFQCVKRMAGEFKSFTRSQKLYCAGLILLPLTVISWLLPFDEDCYILKLNFICFLFAVISDILILYQKVWKTYIGKAFIFTGYAIAANFAYAFSEQFINEIVQYGPVSLDYTSNLVAIMLIPLFIFASVLIILVVFFVLFQLPLILILFFKEIKSNKVTKNLIIKNFEIYYPRLTFILRIVFFPLTLATCLAVANNKSKSYMIFLESKTKAFIYIFEAQKYSRCILQEGEHVIHVNDSEIIIVKKNKESYVFIPQKCKPRL